MRFIAFALSASLASTQVSAAPLVKPGTCELVVASRSSLSAARAYVRSNVSNTKHTKIFKSQNGWYAISIGALTPSEEKPIISKWKSSGKIPRDAYCSTGKKYVGQYDWRTKTKSASKKKSSSGSTGDIVAGAAALAILGAILLNSNKKSSSSKRSSGSSTSYSQKYGCEFVCEGQFGNARSTKFRVNTPHTNSADAQNYVRRQYEDSCKKYPFYSGGGGTASVSYPYCETYYYK